LTVHPCFLSKPSCAPDRHIASHKSFAGALGMPECTLPPLAAGFHSNQLQAICMSSWQSRQIPNRAEKISLPLLAPQPVRNFSGIFPLHGPAYKNVHPSEIWAHETTIAYITSYHLEVKLSIHFFLIISIFYMFYAFSLSDLLATYSE
jgi:hypothetical protein